MKCFVCALALVASSANAEPVKPLVLQEKGMVVLQGEVNGQTVGKAMAHIMAMEGDEVTLVLNSPGGSVIDGARLIQTMKASGKKFTCYAEFAASMAFVTLQACDVRIVSQSSVVMQHQAAYGIGNNQANRVDSFKKFIEDILNDIDTMQAKRMGISVKKLKEISRDDIWLYGQKGVDAGAADVVRPVTCAPELLKKSTKETINTMFGSLEVEWSGCPLITYPSVLDAGKA
jgi:ATP-dependent protease ClpP protease subunit